MLFIVTEPKFDIFVTFIVYVFIVSFSAFTETTISFNPSCKLYFLFPVTMAFSCSASAFIVISFLSVIIAYTVVSLLKFIFPVEISSFFRLLFEFLISSLFTIKVYVLTFSFSLFIFIYYVFLL